MAQEPPQKPGAKHQESYFSFFFQEFAPLILFGFLFVMMMSIPLILSGFLTMEGFAILGAFLVTLGLVFTFPQMMLPFLVLLLVVMFITFPEYIISSSGAFVTGALMVLSIYIGGQFSAYYDRVRRESLNKGDKPAQTVVAAPVEAQEEAEPEEEKKRVFKPVAFDKTIAAEGVTLIFGSESGNAEGLCEAFQAEIEKDGHKVQVLDAEVVDVLHLKAFANLLIATSTWGEGDPPSNAIELHDLIMEDSTPLDMSGSQFSILALGDTNYEQFCECGKRFDRRLEHFGGERLHPRTDCDVDFEEPSNQWLAGVREALKSKGLKTKPVYDESVDAARFEEKEEAAAPAAAEEAKEPASSAPAS